MSPQSDSECTDQSTESAYIVKKIDKQGYVRFTDDPTRRAWEHIRVAEDMLGRQLGKTERVHHINGVKSDNRKENLLVVRSESDHHLIHSKIPHEVFKTSDGSHVVVKQQRVCPHCNRLFVPNSANDVFCSLKCYLDEQISKIPPPEVLAKQVWEMPSTKLAKIYNVSDRMIGKWCDKLGIEKPKRGYWTKQKYGVE